MVEVCKKKKLPFLIIQAFLSPPPPLCLLQPFISLCLKILSFLFLDHVSASFPVRPPATPCVYASGILGFGCAMTASANSRQISEFTECPQ